MEWDDGGRETFPAVALQAQVYDTVEGANPTTLARVWSGDDWNITNREIA